MAKYVRHFKTESAFNTARQNDYIEPWTSVTDGKGLDYNINWKNEYFTVEILSAGQITWELSSGNSIYYSKNGGEWTTFNNSTTLSVSNGDKVRFKGTISDYNLKYFSSTANFNLKGNILSLLTGDDFISSDISGILPREAFRYTFQNCSTLISAKDLKLPKNSTAYFCYQDMFNGCINLIEAPELPAKEIIGTGVYTRMFENCTSLTTAPDLPATKIYDKAYMGMFYGCTALVNVPSILPAKNVFWMCYQEMFYGCTSLQVAPILPALSLAEKCYTSMFNGCTNLNYIKAMFTYTPSDFYTLNWVNGVSATGTFVKNSTAQWNVSGVNGIPEGWTIQTATE